VVLIFSASFFFFQAEDGIRDRNVTGVQPCALPISEYGELVVDIGFGGQFYVQAPASAFGLELHASQAPELIRAANLLLATARECISVVHPTMPHLDQINLPMLYADSANDSATTT